MTNNNSYKRCAVKTAPTRVAIDSSTARSITDENSDAAASTQSTNVGGSQQLDYCHPYSQTAKVLWQGWLP